MTRRNKRWLLILGVVTGLGFIGLYIAGSILSHRFDPYIRKQAISYLEKHFDSEVELTALRVTLPTMSPLKLILRGGRGR